MGFWGRLYEALGERRGIARFGYAYVPLDEALAQSWWICPDGPIWCTRRNSASRESAICNRN